MTNKSEAKPATLKEVMPNEGRNSESRPTSIRDLTGGRPSGERVGEALESGLPITTDQAWEWHKEINDEGICKACEAKAAIQLPFSPEDVKEGRMHASQPESVGVLRIQNETKTAQVSEASESGGPMNPDYDPEGVNADIRKQLISQDERAEFEKWCVSRSWWNKQFGWMSSKGLHRSPDGRYVVPVTQNDWETWQARAELKEPAPLPSQDERAEFEKWAKGKGYDVERWKFDPRVYAREHIQGMWNAWQARAELRGHAPQQSAKEEK